MNRFMRFFVERERGGTGGSLYANMLRNNGRLFNGETLAIRATEGRIRLVAWFLNTFSEMYGTG